LPTALFSKRNPIHALKKRLGHKKSKKTDEPPAAPPEFCWQPKRGTRRASSRLRPPKTTVTQASAGRKPSCSCAPVLPSQEMAVARPTAPPVEPDAVCAPALPLQPKVWSGGRRWAVLLSFSLLSASNAFLLMDFADDYTLSESMLGVDAASVAFLYSLFLLCVMPAMLVAAWAVVHHSAPAVAVAALLNAAAAWLRYAAVLRRSYPLAVASTVLAGFAAAVVVCSYAVIAERWFRPTQRGLATSVAVQSNYFGWAAGSLIGLAEAGDPHKARQLLLGQAIALSCSVPLILLCYRGEAPGVGHAVSDRQAVYESAGQTVNVNNGQAVNANARQAVNANDVPAVNGNARQAVNVNARQAVNPAPVHGRFVAAAAANPTAPTASPANHAPNSPVPVRAVPATSPARRAANPRPTAAPSATAPSQPSPPAPPLGALASARTLGRNRRYWVYAIPYSIIGGVGFAIPSAQDVLLGSSCYPHTSTGAAWHGFDTPHTSFTNLSFILTGVTVGLVAGAAASPAAREGLVLFLALLGALALSLLSFIAEPHTAASMPPEELYPALLVLMSAAGASTVGFIGERWLGRWGGMGLGYGAEHQHWDGDA
jgi:hypothetical protein